jgi:DNA-nicking Smr family endonuclease
VGSIPTHFRQFLVFQDYLTMLDPDDRLSQAVKLPIEDVLDLHPFAPKDIPSVVESYLEAALEAGFFEVRLIHGRGKGVQRQRVRNVVSRSPLVQEFAEAPPERGGWGATLVWLRRSIEVSTKQP